MASFLLLSGALQSYVHPVLRKTHDIRTCAASDPQPPTRQPIHTNTHIPSVVDAILPNFLSEESSHNATET
jgi:hypothetical protein